MKPSLLEKFEEKFYFKTSHIFWHVLTGVAGMALLAGLAILLWGITPSLRPGVTKPIYPEPVAVTLNDVLLQISPPPKTELLASKSGAAVDQGVENTAPADVTPDSSEIGYTTSLDSLKVLLPANKFPWKSRGHWEKEWYRRRKWVTDVWGINDRLKSTFKGINADSFAEKTDMLDSYIKLVANFPQKLRYRALKAALAWSKNDMRSAIYHTDLLHKAMPYFDTEQVGYLEKLSTFGRKNPRDGEAFVEYVLETLPEFSAQSRFSILDEFITSYYNSFNKIDKQKEATAMFLPMLNRLEPQKQPKALNEFYALYLAKNRERERNIDEINATYAHEMQKAESVLAGKKAAKAGYRLLGIQIFGGAILFIAVVALFLVLLSIQRNMRELREVMAGKS